MNWQEHPGFKTLRFGAGVPAFAGIFSLLLNLPETIKGAGKKVVAGGPFTPFEPVIAAGGIGYDPFSYEILSKTGVPGNSELVDSAVESGLSSDFSLANLISVGAAAAKKSVIPVDAFSYMCGRNGDQVKKSLQAMASSGSAPIYFWEVPRYSHESGGWSIDNIVKELKQYFDWLHALTGQKITVDKLKAAIKLGNALRQDIIELTRLQQMAPAVLPSLEYYILQSTAGVYAADPAILHSNHQDLISQLQEKLNRSPQEANLKPPAKKRVYWLGDDTFEYKIFNLLDDCGAELVGCDTRLSFYYELIGENGDPVENLAKWIWGMPCNLPTAERMKVEIPMILEQKPDALIFHKMAGSRIASGAERMVKDIVREAAKLPVLSLETGMPTQNIESLQTTIQTFVNSISH